MRNRRVKPEFANGVGNWAVCLNVLTYASIVSNCAQIFFVSKTYQEEFVSRLEKLLGDNQLNKGRTQYFVFFFYVVLVEHLLFCLKGAVNFLMDRKK